MACQTLQGFTNPVTNLDCLFFVDIVYFQGFVFYFPFVLYKFLFEMYNSYLYCKNNYVVPVYVNKLGHTIFFLC